MASKYYALIESRQSQTDTERVRLYRPGTALYHRFGQNIQPRVFGTGYLAKGLPKVFDQVVWILEANRHANRARLDAGGTKLGARHFVM